MSQAERSLVQCLTHAACLLLALQSATAFAALTVTENAAPGFGTLLSGAGGRQFILNTDDTVTGADAADYLFGATSGELLLHNTGKQGAINILAENISATGGLNVTQILCSYNGGAQQACDGTGITETSGRNIILKIGMEITTSAAHGGGDLASISLDISITFL